MAHALLGTILNIERRLPIELVVLIDQKMRSNAETRIRCHKCGGKLLSLHTFKPFTRNVNTRWQYKAGNLFVNKAMHLLVPATTSSEDCILRLMEDDDDVTPDFTPKTIEIQNQFFENKAVFFNQDNWYRCYIASDNTCTYRCIQCIIQRRVMCSAFQTWMRQGNASQGRHL